MIHDGGHNTRVVVINESGLYSLILSSKLEQAKAFKRWVTSEVLPATMPLRRLMLDFDEKGHTDEIKARLMQKSPPRGAAHRGVGAKGHTRAGGAALLRLTRHTLY